jgi:23S rRNA pseudouridine1911/1915/1917 synthase
MTTKRREGREARTDWSVIALIGPFTLLEIQLHTGRTHQIRVHLSAVGHPVVGDAVYGAPREPIVNGKKLSTLGRPFLHAARIGFVHPTSGKRVTFRAPIDPALRTYLAEIAEAAGMPQASIDAGLKAYL